MIAFIDPMKKAKEGLSIVVVLEDGLLVIAPRGNVVEGARVLYAKRASHAPTLAFRENECKLNRPDSMKKAARPKCSKKSLLNGTNSGV